MKVTTRSRFGFLGAASLTVVAVAAACNDADRLPTAAAGSPSSEAGAGGAGEGGTTHRGGQAGDGGAGHSGTTPNAGQAGEGGSAGVPVTCDCGDDPSFVHAPLDCACAAGLCTTLDEDLKQDFDRLLGWPYIVLRGTCAGGYQVLDHHEACENGGRRTYDAQGKLVYSSYGPYGAPLAVCESRRDAIFGDFGIGAEDPAKDCQLCVLTHANDDGAGGAGGAAGAAYESCIADDLAKYAPCEP